MPDPPPTSELQLESRLESICANTDPVELARFLAIRHKRFGDPRSGAFEIAPHQVSRMLSAACAYHRFGRATIAAVEAYRKMHRLLNSYHSEYLHEVLAEGQDIDRAFVAMFGEQAPLQDTVENSDLYRLLYILSESPRVARYQESIKGAIGGAPHEVIVFCTLVQNFFASIEHTTISVEEFSRTAGNTFASIDWQHVLSLMSQSVAECGSGYKATRERIRFHKYRGLARSVFLEKPLLRISDDLLLAPLPLLLERWSRLEIQRIVLASDAQLADRVRLAYQDFVGLWLAATPTLGEVLKEDEIPRREGEKVCDFLCLTDDAAVFVEVKCSDSMPACLTFESLRRHTILQRVCEGIYQTSEVARRLVAGELGRIAVGQRKLYSIVVVLGEVPIVNKDVFVEQVVKPRYVDEGHSPDDFDLFDRAPQIIDNRGFERVCTYLQNTAKSIRELFDDRDAYSHSEVGDWYGLINVLPTDIPMRYPQFLLDGMEPLQREVRRVVELFDKERSEKRRPA